MQSDRKIIKKYGKIANKIIELEEKYSHLKDEEFILKTNEFKEMLKNGYTLEDILIDVYAVAREVAFRILKLKAYKVQLVGAIILHYGDIAEMKTGEGKTLTGLFPAYLNSLDGKGVHIVTVNEYLSRRDFEEMQPVFNLLGITSGLNGSSHSKDEKKDAYSKDITYTTNTELGFDYLRDNMAKTLASKVQRELNYCIIDEADSVLIDESRTPLIISGGTTIRSNLYKEADIFAKTLKEKDDFEIDLEFKQIFLNDQGMKKAEDYFSLKKLFAVENTEKFHLIMNALKANFIFKEGIEYTTMYGDISLIDQSTGRIMDGRSYSDGLQQAIQAKEGVEIEEETTTLATITYQNFYRLYSKISGMTGTAKTEEEEFIKIYNTRVISTPTNKPIIRKDETDYAFGTKHAALKKLVTDIQEIHKKGAPILVGTTSVESSEQISRYLEKAGLKFEMINAKNHSREAEIVAKAGQVNAITLSTNMAGRGTDIKLSDESKKLGGLHVLGVERNESRRIDNQLRGRSGRQGDPGMSRYYISMDDDLMIRFTTPKIRERFRAFGDDYIKSRIFTRSVTNAQKKLEGMNFDQRKNVLDYDNILAQQREIIYAQRNDILSAENLDNVIKKFQVTFAYDLLDKNSIIVHDEKAIDSKKVLSIINGIYVPKNYFKEEDFHNKEKLQLANEIGNAMFKLYKIRINDIDANIAVNMEKNIMINAFDHYWTKHLNLAGKLKSGVYLQQYAQNNPLAIYIEQATFLFNSMKIQIASDVTDKLMNVILTEYENTKENKKVITSKDIDEILNDIGLSNQKINREIINNKFKELIDKNKNDEEALKKIKLQYNIMIGLILELEKRNGIKSDAEAKLESHIGEETVKVKIG